MQLIKRVVRKAKKPKQGSEQLKRLEATLKELSSQKLGNVTSYTNRNVCANTFNEWGEYLATQTNDPDRMRNALYYGFQPLMDALLSDRLMDSQRPIAIETFNAIIQTSINYLVSYYKGRPDLSLVTARIEEIRQHLARLEEVPYKLKFRNVDHNQIFPKHIHRFLIESIEHILDEQLILPDYIVGAACGSSELAMPFAGILETPIGFIRMSKRRDDREPLVVEEQEREIKIGSTTKNVLCIEDFVCTGKSLQGIMKRVRDYKAANVKGISCKYSAEGSYLKVDTRKEDFVAFSLRN